MFSMQKTKVSLNFFLNLNDIKWLISDLRKSITATYTYNKVTFIVTFETFYDQGFYSSKLWLCHINNKTTSLSISSCTGFYCHPHVWCKSIKQTAEMQLKVMKRPTSNKYELL